MSHTGTYQFFSSIGSKPFAMQITLPVPIPTLSVSNTPKVSVCVTGSNTLKFFIAVAKIIIVSFLDYATKKPSRLNWHFSLDGFIYY